MTLKEAFAARKEKEQAELAKAERQVCGYSGSWRHIRITILKETSEDLYGGFHLRKVQKFLGHDCNATTVRNQWIERNFCRVQCPFYKHILCIRCYLYVIVVSSATKANPSTRKLHWFTVPCVGVLLWWSFLASSRGYLHGSADMLLWLCRSMIWSPTTLEQNIHRWDLF